MQKRNLISSAYVSTDKIFVLNYYLVIDECVCTQYSVEVEKKCTLPHAEKGLLEKAVLFLPSYNYNSALEIIHKLARNFVTPLALADVVHDGWI